MCSCELKVSENTAHEYNIQPYSTFTSVIIPTFSALINYHIRACIIWRSYKTWASECSYHQAVPAANTVCMHAIYILLHQLVKRPDSKDLQVIITQGEM